MKGSQVAGVRKDLYPEILDDHCQSEQTTLSQIDQQSDSVLDSFMQRDFFQEVNAGLHCCVTMRSVTHSSTSSAGGNFGNGTHTHLEA